MIRIWMLLAALVGTIPPAGAQPAVGSELFDPVLAYEAQFQRGRTCVPLQTEGVAFGRDREMLILWRDHAARNPEDAQGVGRALRNAETRTFDWRLPDGRGRGGADDAPPLGEAEAERLNAAARAIIHAPSAEAPEFGLDPSSIPAPLRPGQPWLGRCATLSLSAPAVAGDLAFIETSYVCGGLCGNGRLYALRREAGRWRLVAVAFTWVS